MSAERARPDPLARAVARIRAGGLVAYPTETVWGLGADARSEAAVAALLRFKGRSPAQPISILVADLAALGELGIEVGDAAARLAAAFWPGPLTLVLPSRGGLAPGVAREDGAVGVRCSPHPVAAALARRLRAAGVGPVTATSLNASGAAPARTREEARAACARGPGGPAPELLEVEGADAGAAPASTVVDLTGPRPAVLRWGALGATALEPVLAPTAAGPGASAA